jgi:3-oxoacyl-[acyl-carrier-protein] synthase II
MSAWITNADVLSPYGPGLEPLWLGLNAGESAIRTVDWLGARAFITDKAALVPGLAVTDGSRVQAMLTGLWQRLAPGLVPRDAGLILATTAGEVDLLQQAVLTGSGDPAASVPDRLLARIASDLGLTGRTTVVSAACASASVAIARAAAIIGAGESTAILVVAADAVTEFVCSGFSAMMALSPDRARPFDRDRDGLSLGEGAGWVLLMDGDRAARQGRPCLGTVAGWGCTNDANHMTGPARDGAGLALAIHRALRLANCQPRDVDAVSAHGTGTRYNDAMEMVALRRTLGEAPVPTYSVKGGTGHPLGAAGLLETVVAARAMAEHVVPPTPGLREPATEAIGWVRTTAVRVERLTCLLLINAGFGGIDSALLLRRPA